MILLAEQHYELFLKGHFRIKEVDEGFSKRKKKVLKWSLKGQLVLKLNTAAPESFAKTFESFICWSRLLEL